MRASRRVSDWSIRDGGARSMESRSQRISQAFDSVSFLRHWSLGIWEHGSR